MEENIISKSTKLKIILTVILIFSITAIGLSYSYFTISVTGNNTASSISVTMAQLSLTYLDGDTINVSGIYPGWSDTKTFTVTNNTENATYYDIKMQDVYTTFNHDELVYTLTSTNGGGTKSETIMPNNDGLIKARVLIVGNTTQTYTMTITFKEIGDYQDYNQGVTYRGKIQIVAPYTYTDGSVNDIKLVDRIMLDNTTAYATNTSSKYVTRATGINYDNPSDYSYDGYFVYKDEIVNFTSNANKYIGTSFSYDATSGKFTLTGTKVSSKTYSTDYIGQYTCHYINSSVCYNDPQELYKILEVTGSTVTKVERYVAKPNLTSWNGLGLYQTATNTVNNQPTYFFRGHVINNYVSFAGDIWRIVRINEDGSIRMIRQTNYVSAKFNTSNNNAMYVGYMYGTSSDPYVNTNNSNIKAQLEAYYDSKLASYSSYLADIEFCNDRTNTTSGSNVYYGVYNRLVLPTTNKSPQFTCPNETRDLFTMNTSSRGNKKLTKSVGLLTQDESAYAGVVNTKLSLFYLNNNAAWWTSSPSYFYSSTAYGFIGLSGGYNSGYGIANAYGVRPVISLKSNTLVLGGSGTVNDPYVITE